MARVLSPVRAAGRASYVADVQLVARAVIASSLTGSAIIHGTVAGEHFGEWVPAGVFFLGIQLVELVLALLAVYAWSSRVAALVVATGLLTVAVWLLSRTLGTPIGPDDFRVPEPVGVPDTACGLLELMSVAAAAAALRLTGHGRVRPRRRSEAGPSRRGLAVATTAVWAAVVLTAWGAAPAVLDAEGHAHGGSTAGSGP